MSHKYKNTSNINKLLKRTFITKRNIIINQKLLLQKNINIYIVKKTQKKYFYDYANRNNVEYKKN